MKILLVDGGPGVAEALAQSLQPLGWPAVGAATDSDGAVEWINQQGGCDILVTEVFLQPADGFTLRETIQPHLPGMKTLFTSIYDASAHTERMAGCEFLQAPLTPEVLDAALRKLTSPAPVVTPVAASPRPTPVAASPQPTPVAASPRPTPVAASPRPTPVAASPRPTPVAASHQPTPVAASPQPKAAMPVASSSSASKASAKYCAQPLSTHATPSAVPVKASAPTPLANPHPSPARATTAPSLGSEIELPPDHLVGQTVANYRVEACIGRGPLGPIYRARQTNIERLVRFYVLDASLAADPNAINRFLSNASAKAKATNPVIVAVYEAGESEGVYFYSCEYIPCRSVGQLRESGGTLDETTALAVLKAAAEALDYFAREKIDHDLLTENALLIGPANRVRVANIASNNILQPYDLKAEMQRVGEIVLGVLPPSGTPKARDLAVQLTRPAAAPASWAAFLQNLATQQPKAVIADAYKLDAQERAAIRVVEESKKRQKRGMLINTVVSLSLLAAALAVIYLFVIRGSKSATVRNLEEMVEVPAGDFIYQDGQKVNLPTFYIDKYEVTIGQYAQFLDFIEKNPNKIAQFEDPGQPKGKSHIPAGWADKNELTPPFPGYYHRAQQWGRYEKAPLDVNSPVFGVDWFDAYAYAKWKGKRLPTEQEWEKAARGTDGRKFSWGNNEDPTRANTGADLDADPEKGGDKDGFKRWNPVDAKPGDKSPFGMVGASGNVSEWTATIVPSPEGGGKVPVIRGGNWENPDPSVTRRVLKLMDLQQAETLGFRAASDTAPAKK